ncbi:MAG TPA: hypothetical protein VGC55_08800 [Dokdonella sp.]
MPRSTQEAVIPAKAGIHFALDEMRSDLRYDEKTKPMDSRLRGNDEVGLSSTPCAASKRRHSRERGNDDKGVNDDAKSKACKGRLIRPPLHLPPFEHPHRVKATTWIARFARQPLH